MSEVIINVKDNEFEIIVSKKSFNTISIKKKAIISVECEKKENNEYKYDTILNINKIKTTLKKNKIKAKKAEVVLSINELITREVTIPKIKKEEIYNFINNNIEEYFTINKEEFKFDYKITSIDTKENKLNLLLIAIPKQRLFGLKALLKAVGIYIKKISIYPDSILQLFSDAKGSIACLDIGKKRSTITIIKNGNIFLYSVINIVIEDDAEYEYELREIVDNFVYFFNFYSSRNFGEKIENIFVVGELSYDISLKRILGEQLDSNINIGIKNRKAKFKDKTSRSKYNYTALMGRYFVQKPIYKKQINFNESYERTLKHSLRLKLTFYVIVLTLISISWMYGLNYYVNKKILDYDKNIDSQISAIGVYESQYNDLITKKEILNDEIEILNEIDKKNFDYKFIFETLKNGLPLSCRIKSLEVDNSEINTTFEIVDKKTLEAAKLIIAINKMGIFEPIEIEELNMNDTVDEIDVTLKLKQ